MQKGERTLFRIIDNARQVSYNYHMIVFDASTMILLSRSGMFELFVSTFDDRIMIPERVKAEVCREGKEETPLIDGLIRGGRIEVLPANDRKSVEKLKKDFSIDTGESEALILAIEKNVSLIATDDRNAIRACKMLNLEFTTALAFIVTAVENNHIGRSEALSRIDKLESIARYKKSIISDIKQQLQGGDNGNKDFKHTGQ